MKTIHRRKFIKESAATAGGIIQIMYEHLNIYL